MFTDGGFGGNFQAKNQEYRREQDRELQKRIIENLKTIGISDNRNFLKWCENVQRWFGQVLVPQVVDQNMSNIKELNKTLSHFDKRLYEYEIILHFDQALVSDGMQKNSTSSVVTIDELMNYDSSVRRGGPMWNSSRLSPKDSHEANRYLFTLIYQRHSLEQYFKLDHFDTQNTR